MYARIAWSLAALTGLLAVADTAITAASRPLLAQSTIADHGWPFVTLAAAGSTVMGALIISRYPRHRVGWLLSVVGFCAAFSVAAEAYAIWVLSAGGPGSSSTAQFIGWLSVFFGASGSLTGLAIMFLIVPDGHFMSRRWRVAGVAALGGLILYQAGVLATPPSHMNVITGKAALNPFAEICLNIGVLVITAAMVAAAVSLILRLRRSEGVMRQQLRWIAVSGASLPLGVLILIAVEIVNGGVQTGLASLPLYVAYFALPIFTAIAVLRFRLYDLDVILNRAAFVTIATVFAALGYIGLVVGVGAVVGAHAGGFWPSLLGTAIVAVAFQPLRRWVVRVADRIGYGEQAAPYEALADLNRRLAESPSPDQLLPAIAEAAAVAVAASSADASVAIPGGSPLFVRWPEDAAEPETDAEEFPLVDSGEVLGHLTVVVPAGRTLRPRDRRLLLDICRQAALALSNIRLEMQLIGRVEQLDRRTVELAESRARLIAVRDAERARTERALRRDVIPRLGELPAALQQLRRADVSDRETKLAALVEESVQALESLREITRGIYPTQLTSYGLGPAIASHLGREGRRGSLKVRPSVDGMRYDSRIEAAAYFCYLETARELQPPIEVCLDTEGNRLVMRIAGKALATPDLQHLTDRLEPLGGDSVLASEDGVTVLTVTLPITAEATIAAPATVTALRS
jgi:hypothetical protein